MEYLGLLVQVRKAPGKSQWSWPRRTTDKGPMDAKQERSLFAGNQTSALQGHARHQVQDTAPREAEGGRIAQLKQGFKLG